MATMTSPDPMRVLVVDDHDTFAELLVGALDREVDLSCVGHATTAAEGVAMVDRLRPDVVLMDIQLPDMDGFAATEQILAADSTVRVVILTAHASAHLVARAARAGACAFLHKTGHLSDVLTTLRTARTGDLTIDPALAARLVKRGVTTPSRPTLTPREQEVLELMGTGKDVTTIARELQMAPHTCRGHVKSLLAKLGAHSQLEAVIVAVRTGLIHLDEV
jgi:DNA-binding NarL/FixJ family response regulator